MINSRIDDKELSANTTLSHYRIINKLGAGGMGEVYLAQDTSEQLPFSLDVKNGSEGSLGL